MKLEFAQLLTTRHKFASLDVTSRVEIDCAGSSLCQACYFSWKRIRIDTYNKFLIIIVLNIIFIFIISMNIFYHYI